ncbi:MAG: serine hydrolase, partial [Pseudomonadota bacterium]
MTDDIVRSHYQRRPDGITLANWRDAPHNRWAFQHVGTLVPSVEIPSAAIDAGESREDAREELGDLRVGSHRDGTRVRLDELLVRSETTVLEVMKNGRRVYEWAAPHRDANAPHLLFSVTKSLTALLAGVLVGQGALDENAPVTRYVPECAESAYGDATVRHLLDMTVCAAFDESYLDRSGDYARYRVATAWNPTDVDSDGEDHDRTAGLHDFLPTIPRGDGAHGARVHYLS